MKRVLMVLVVCALPARAFATWSVVAVDRNRVPAERAIARDERVEIVIPLRRAALTEPVDVRERADVVELVKCGDLGRLPDGAFSRFAVAQQHVGAIVRADPVGVERAADGRYIRTDAEDADYLVDLAELGRHL